ncbi:hypothetical protein AOLI_G00040190 [Acnodon oligacanthus]
MTRIIHVIYGKELLTLNICKTNSPHSSTGKRKTPNPQTFDTMSSSKVLPVFPSWSPEFVEELLPSAQQVALLYNLSYLCLAKFPKLERLLRMRAVETQLLFGSSEAVLLKCEGTSQNLVSSLFPMLILAVEKNKPVLAVKILEKARRWINEIISHVGNMEKRYETLNKDVATTTSDVITEKRETEKHLTVISQEAEAMKAQIKRFEAELSKTTAQLTETEQKIDAKNRELQDLVKEEAVRNSGLGILASIVPFTGAIIKAIYDFIKSPAVAEKIRVIESQQNRLTAEKISLKQKQWDLQVQTIEWQMKLAKLEIDKDIIPEPTYLGDVQCFLSKIQEILIALKVFWSKVYEYLGTIKENTFSGEDLLEQPELKEEFTKLIKTASTIWDAFGVSCEKAAKIFSLQSKDAYSFLEIDPSSLSTEVWQKEYDSVKDQLQHLKVTVVQSTPAIQN